MAQTRRRKKRDARSERVKEEFGALVDDVALDPKRKRALKSRWLEQLVWIEDKANETRERYYALRLTTVVGAVIVPALVSVTTVSGGVGVAAKVAAWVVSLVVAISAAVEQFFHFGDRWRNYRQTAEQLKAEGWLFLQLSGPYQVDGATHERTYPSFAARVEELLKTEVDFYLTRVAVEKDKDGAPR
jgi:hypothetical protein